MRLHVHGWGEEDAPAVVCVHGVSGHGERYKRLAEERWAKRFRIVAPDLRGHGRSGWEAPWTYATHVADLVETADALGVGLAHWVGHSFGGRLVLELAAAHPERVARAVLLDPAIDVLPHIALQTAEDALAQPVYDSAEDYAARWPDSPPGYGLEDAGLHCETLPDGRLRRRTCQAAVVSIYGEMATPAPSPTTLHAPTLLLYAPAYGLVREDHLARYADRVQIIAVPGMHMVMWDAFDEVAGAVEQFLD